MVRLAGLLAVIGVLLPSAARADSLTFTLTVPGRFPEPVACPSGASSDEDCKQLTGSGTTPGLGQTTATAVITVLPRAGGGWDSTVAGTITTTHGTLTFVGDNSAAPTGNPLYAITFSGAGGFGSATGSGTFNFSGSFAGNGRFIVDGSINGPSARFDTTPPNVIVDRSSTRRLAGDRYSVMVHYHATDAGGLSHAELFAPGVPKPLWGGPVDGMLRATIHVRLKPRRITLRLVVTDTSANVAAQRIVVKLT